MSNSERKVKKTTLIRCWLSYIVTSNSISFYKGQLFFHTCVTRIEMFTSTTHVKTHKFVPTSRYQVVFVTNLQQTCFKLVLTTYIVLQFNNLSTTCQQVVSDKLVATCQNNSIVIQLVDKACSKLRTHLFVTIFVRFFRLIYLIIYLCRCDGQEISQMFVSTGDIRKS
jgi:hypothetical protein